MQSTQHKSNNKKEENSIVQVMTKYIPYWPMFLIFLLLSVAGAYTYLRFTTPKYQASATIIIKDERKGYDDSKLMESLDLINTKKIIENEVEVLQSKTLMNSVVKKLHLYAPIYQEGKFKSISAYTIAPIKIEVEKPDEIKPVKRIDFKYDDNTNTVLLAGVSKYPINEWVNTSYGKLKFVPNKAYLGGNDKKKPLYFSLFQPKRLAGNIAGQLAVSPSSKLSSVINLFYKDEVPRRAEDILNELINSYSESALVEKNTLAKNTLSFIEERLNVVSRDLDSIERNLQKYKAGRGAVDISKQGQIYLENVSSTDKRLTDVNMQASVLDQLEKSASSPGKLGVLPSTLGINDPALTQQMNNLSALQLQYEKLKPTVGESNPLLISITEQINQIKPTILSNIQSQRKNLEQSKNSLYATSGAYNSMISSIPQKERQLVEITRDQNIKNGIYSFLLQKREESELSLASSLSDSKVVNFAQSSGVPVSPNKNIIYMMAIAIALACPIAFITAKESFSPKILYRSEIETLTKMPIVGEISFNKTKETLVIESGKRTVIAEEFRKVRVSLLSNNSLLLIEVKFLSNVIKRILP